MSSFKTPPAGAYSLRPIDRLRLVAGRLGEMLNRARRAGLIRFTDIRDDGAEIVTAMGYRDAHELIATWRDDARYFRLDRQVGQPHRLLFMVEAAGMKPQIEAVARDYSIPVIASGGFDSLTAKRSLAMALGEHDGLTEVLHVGDHDPSGVHLFSSMAEDVAALIAHTLVVNDIGDSGSLPGDVLFTRLAVTPQQIADLALPTAPPKATDRRRFEGETVQAEAIAPDVLADILAAAITDRLDNTAFERILEHEQHIREGLVARLQNLEGGAS